MELSINEGDPRGRSIFVEQCGSAKMSKFVYSEVEPGSLAKIERKKTIFVHHSKQEYLSGYLSTRPAGERHLVTLSSLSGRWTLCRNSQSVTAHDCAQSCGFGYFAVLATVSDSAG